MKSPLEEGVHSVETILEYAKSCVGRGDTDENMLHVLKDSICLRDRPGAKVNRPATTHLHRCSLRATTSSYSG